MMAMKGSAKVCFCLLAIALPLATCEDGDDVTKTGGVMAVKFRGKSGKFTIFSKDLGEQDTNKVTFEIEEIREVDAIGNEVGATGNPKHQRKSFANTEFSFSYSNDVEVGSATANLVSFSSLIEGIGMLKVDTFMMQDTGVVGPNMTSPGIVSWDTSAGDVKFNIEISDWKWCGDGAVCLVGGQPQFGAFIDVDIEVKGAKSTPEKKEKGGRTGRGEAYDLGGAIDMELTSDVDLDGDNSIMPAGYPKVRTRGSKQVFTFRFPKFSDKAVYDPLLRTSNSDSLLGPAPTPSPPTPPPSLIGAPHSQVVSASLLFLMSMFAWFEA